MILYDFVKIPQSFFVPKKRQLPLQGCLCRTGQGLSLRFNIFFNLIVAVNRYIYANFLGGSKPPPYHVVVCFVSLATAFGCLSLTMQLLLSRKNHARLACSVVNALTTAHCRYQLLRIADNRRGCPTSHSSLRNGFTTVLSGRLAF